MFKKIITYSTIILLGIVGIFGMSGNFVFAADSSTATTNNAAPTNTQAASSAAPTDASKSGIQTGLQSVVSFVNTLLSILTIAVTPAVVLASWLMSPDWTTGDLFNLRPVLHNMWIMISNITYFIYAVLLVFIALATIFNSDHYGYKALLPRLALGIILVPLTWWFVQFIISLSTIVTASVINIPAEVMMKVNANENGGSTWWTTPVIPAKTTFDNAGGNVIHTCASKTEIAAMQASQSAINNPNDAALQTSASNAWQASLDSEINGVEEGTCISPKDFIQSAGGMYSPLLIYGFGVFKFQEIKAVNSGLNAVNDIGQLVNQGVIGVIMFLVYGILVIALISILMMRAIKLWVYAMFSPLFTLKYVLGDGMKKLDESGTFNIGEFIALAFSPAVIGITLSFGLVIVSALLHPPVSTANNNTDCTPAACTITMFGNSNSTMTSTTIDDPAGNGGKISVTTVSVGGASWEFKGSITKGNDTAVISSALNTAGGIIGTIIVDIIALIFIWVAFKAGTGLSKATEAAFKPFADIGQKIGEAGAALPKYVPIPGTGQNVASLEKMAQLGGNKFEEMHRQDSEARVGKLFPSLVNGIFNAEMAKNVTDAAGKVGGLSTDKKLDGMIASTNAAVGTMTDTKFNYDGLADALKKAGITSQPELEAALRGRGISTESEINAAVRLFMGKKDELTESDRKKLPNILSKLNEKVGGNTIANFNISSITDPKTATVSNSDDIIKNIKDHFGNDHTDKTNKDELKKKLEELLNGNKDKDAIISKVLNDLSNDYFKKTNP